MPVAPTQTDSASTPPRIRKEIRNLSADERGLFIAAVKRLKASGTADRLTKMHIDYQTILAGAQQLPWLRQFIFNFERELQDIDAAVTIPYWDAAYDGARPERSPVFSPNWAGGNGAGLSHVVVQAGAFGEWHADYPESHQLRRAWNGGTWITAWQTTEVINAIVAQETTYAAFRARLIHFDGAVHTGIGGDMATMAAPTDPIFYLHAANIDRIWATWQEQKGNLAEYDGSNGDGSPASLNDMLSGNTPLSVKDVLAISKLGYAYSPLSPTPTTSTTVTTPPASGPAPTPAA